MVDSVSSPHAHDLLLDVVHSLESKVVIRNNESSCRKLSPMNESRTSSGSVGTNSLWLFGELPSGKFPSHTNTADEAAIVEKQNETMRDIIERNKHHDSFYSPWQ
jgi:hypothetical protein